MQMPNGSRRGEEGGGGKLKWGGGELKLGLNGGGKLKWGG